MICPKHGYEHKADDFCPNVRGHFRYGSVCSGIEAATVAWHPLGWEPAWFSEIEKFPSVVLAHHYPDVPNLGDMTKLENHAGRTRIDLLVGGTPCQAFSVAGQRKGLADDRGQLSLTYCRLAEATGARWTLWENVVGVLSSADNAFGCFLAGLAGADDELRSPILGGGWPCAGVVSGSRYGLAWRVLDAKYFGVPQQRPRVFVVGCRGDWRSAASVLLEPFSMEPHRLQKSFEGIEVHGTCACRGSGTIENAADWIVNDSGRPRWSTPLERERLQGFPDNYTAIPYRGSIAKDSPRYDALGNSMAVPAMRWIGQRIQLVEASLRTSR